MKISYYPGCTLKANAKNFEDSALCSLKQLGLEVEELRRWNCCGTVYSLATDDLIHHIAPIRNLIFSKEAKSEALMTLCAMCYNTLKRANERIKKSRDDRDIINRFMDAEGLAYEGDVKVLHLLELLRDEIKFENVAKKVVKPLKNLKVASYYGCLLVRPKEIGLDDVENPRVLENLMTALGADPVDFPYKTECCASYQTVDNPGIVAERTYRILTSAQRAGADVVSVSCPLCAFNLDNRQKETVNLYSDFKKMPILYFTQLLGIALGCPEEALRFDLHGVDPKPALKQKGLL
ncbi:MAG: CoB--CoM heterodisulfide reductase iron-sulfur subunit B family protein [Candidatus Aminicenantes bacterium]|jgi:heterodisulfide reductase subunit B|nr:CoB--CoM heterodisulfide reductase iron-sulfur subunit B family protein [Candidatus Aminicenantes bacterium]